MGTEILANTEITDATPERPRVLVLSSGDILFAWSRNDTSGERGVVGRRFQSDGTSVDASDVLIESQTYSRYPDMAELGNGKIVIVYTVSGGTLDGGSNGIAFKIFSSSLTEVVGRTQANTYTSGSQDSPSIKALPNNRFAIVWTSGHSDNGDI